MRTTSIETADLSRARHWRRQAREDSMHDEQRMLGDAVADIVPDELSVTVLTTMAAAEPYWRRLEASAVLTPYQRFDWLAPLLTTREIAGDRLAIAVVCAGATPVALLPLAVRPRFGIVRATLLGSDLGSVGWMPFVPDAAPALTPTALRRIISEIGRQAGPIDVVTLVSQVRNWSGHDNPLLTFPHQPAPDHFYRGAVADQPGNKRLRNILRGKRRLEESFGPVALRRADDPDGIARIHAAFLAQRDRRFSEQGIVNVFADDWVVEFFRTTARQGLADERPALRLHALEAGGEIVATTCGSYCGTHYSQYINSTTDGPAAKSSLMGLLMHELTAELTAEGITSLDMGLGDFSYKNDWTGTETVYDIIVPLTVRGRPAASALRGLRRLRRTVKQNPTLFGFAKRLRALLRQRG